MIESADSKVLVEKSSVIYGNKTRLSCLLSLWSLLKAVREAEKTG